MLRFWQGGSNEGFKSLLFGYADLGQGVVVMTNGEQGISLIQELVRSVATVYHWATPQDLP